VEDRGAELPAANEGRMGTLVMQDDALPAVGRIIPVRLVGRGPSQFSKPSVQLWLMNI
jgi:hypothetical protein